MVGMESILDGKSIFDGIQLSLSKTKGESISNEPTWLPTNIACSNLGHNRKIIWNSSTSILIQFEQNIVSMVVAEMDVDVVKALSEIHGSFDYLLCYLCFAIYVQNLSIDP
jgi:hypothetical protein